MENIEIAPELYPYFEKAGQTIIYHPGQCIYYQGDLSNKLYLIKKGRVRAFFLDLDGKDLTIEIIENGRIFGESSFLSHTTRATTVEAISEVELYACTFDSLLPYITTTPPLTIALFKLLIRSMENLSFQLHNLYFLDRHQKVASFLLEQTAHPNAEKGITSTCIPYTHQEIAYCVGLSRGSVTRVLNQFQEERLVLLQYKLVIIKDRTTLLSYLS